MRLLPLCIAFFLVLGCSVFFGSGASVDYIVQNIGSREIDHVYLEFGEQELHSGFLPSMGSGSMTMSFRPKSGVVLIKFRQDGVEHVFRVDIGNENLQMLSKGGSALFFQINPDDNEVLYNRYGQEAAYDFVLSKEKLTNAVKAVRVKGSERGSVL